MSDRYAPRRVGEAREPLYVTLVGLNGLSSQEADHLLDAFERAVRAATVRHVAEMLTGRAPASESPVQEAIVMAANDGTGQVRELVRLHSQLTRERVLAEVRSTEPHVYLSTGCLHGDHVYCRSESGVSGAKTPGRCKHCPAVCVCGCREEES